LLDRRTMSAQLSGRYAFLTTILLGACGLADDPELGIASEDQALSGNHPGPGAPGIGDVLYPTLGNGGYDVRHYDLDLRYETAAPTQPIDGTVRIEARATQALSSFNLDFSGESIGAVELDGCDASYTWDGEEIVITPSRPLRRHERFTVTVSHFTARPAVPVEFLDAPFFITADGTAWAMQPHNAHRVFPSNDHPRDMASFSFELDVPAGTTAVANGELTGKRTARGRTTWRYRQREPMATELAQVTVGAMAVTRRGRHDGVFVRDVTPGRLTADLEPKLEAELAHMEWLTEQLGDYPFQSYGSLVVDSAITFALETQTLSLYPATLFDREQAGWEPIMVHELAHQWFGNSVAPASWSDLWQNEGHATWYEVTFQLDPDSPELEEGVRFVYSLGDIWRAAFGPVAAPLSGDPALLFSPQVYGGGAIVLYALRQEVGDATFRAIEREWVTRYRGRSASTSDFIALASEVAGRDLSEFLHDWLYGITTPPMPGHPDWTVEPVPPSPSPLARSQAVALPGPFRSAALLLRH
jgi:aminopeptidase N